MGYVWADIGELYFLLNKCLDIFYDQLYEIGSNE